MQVTINITDRTKLPLLLELLKKQRYIDHIDFGEEESGIPQSHKDELDRRLEMAERGEMGFTDWEEINAKYVAEESEYKAQ